MLHNEGTEAWEKDKAERETLLTEFVPYMRLHCNLSEQDAPLRICWKMEKP